MSKTFQFQIIQFSQTVLIQTIQFSISIVFVHIQLNIKTVLFQTIQFSMSTQFTCQNSFISSNSVYAKLTYYLNYSWKDKRIHTIPKDISPKVNAIERLKFELYDVAVQYPLSHGTPNNLVSTKPGNTNNFQIDLFDPLMGF